MSTANRVLVVFVAGVLVAGFVALGASNGDSYHYNISWSVAFHEALSMGDPYPRYLPGLWAGHGGMDFYFYAPLPFYVSAIAQFVVPELTPNAAIAVSGAFFWIGSGITAGLFLRRIVGGWSVVAGAFIYMVLPYHLSIDWAIRQAIGEFAAYMFVPLVALGMWRALDERRLNIVLPLGFAGLALCHLPTTLLSLPVFATIWVAWAISTKQEILQSFVRLTLLCLLGVGLSAIYWWPALANLSSVSAEFLKHYHPVDWLMWNGQKWPVSDWQVAVNLTLTFTGIFIGLCWIIGVRALGASGGYLWIWSIAPTIVATILMSNVSVELWKHSPFSSVQFPWRVLVYVDFFVMVAAAFLIDSAWQKRKQDAGLQVPVLVWFTVMLFLIVLFHYPHRMVSTTAYQVAWEERNDPRSVNGALEYLSADGAGKFARDYLNTTIDSQAFEDIPDHLAGLERDGVLHPTADVTAIKSRVWEIKNVPAGVNLLPVLYHEAFQVQAPDGQVFPVQPALDIGVVSVELPQAYDRVEMVLQRHPTELPAALVSLFSLLVLMGMTIRGRVRRN